MKGKTTKNEVVKTAAKEVKKRPLKPTTLNKFEAVLSYMIEEGKSLRAACKEIGFSRVRFYEIIKEDETKANQYARARELAIETIIDETLELADNTADRVPNVMKTKLQIEARQWYATKLYAKKFGNKVDVEANVTERIKIVLDLGDENAPGQ